MKVSLKWLRDYVPVSLEPKELAHKLTMAGLEVGGVEEVGEAWEGVCVGKVREVNKHPNADRLSLCIVDIPGETHEVVCGAPNVAAGQNIAFAKVGAQLFDGHSGKSVKLKAAKIRGVVSNGMICSEKELGMSEEHEGILVLPEDAPPGMPLFEYLGDSILELELTPNRPDCLSMLGVAQEVSALTGEQNTTPNVAYEEEARAAVDLASVEIADPDLCSRYTASIVTGLKVGPSPVWMQERLKACGMRPINNVVDITNYVMMEYGQPLHAFDYDKIKDHKIIVRRARAGERLLTLDGELRTLDPEMQVISDPDGPIGLAGVMGGGDSEVSETTTSLLLESANFDNVNIRRTSTRLRLRSEASLRFDKGLSPELPPRGLRRATQLLAELADGMVAKGIIDVYPGAKESASLHITEARIKQVLGIPIGLETVRGVLESLGFGCEDVGEGTLKVDAPYWRTDIGIEDDLVEEVARIRGYDDIPTTPLSGRIPPNEPDDARSLRDRVKDLLAGSGMQEVVNYSLSDVKGLENAGLSHLAQMKPLKVANPLRVEQEYLRLSLRPGLLANVEYNKKYHHGPLLMFEAGKVYIPRNRVLPEEQEVLAGVVTGDPDDPMDGFLRTKGVLEMMLGRLGVDMQFERGEGEGLHPGRVVQVSARGERLAVLGEVHPQVVEAFDIEGASVHVFEVDMDRLLAHLPATKRYKPVSRYPGALRDLALIVEADTPSRAVQEVIESFPLVTSVELFDVYTGDQVAEDKKSLAFRVLYQSSSRTLGEHEVNMVQAQLLEKLGRETGAALRG